MDILAFTVPGEARGKGRPRATAIGGHARMFTDAKTASYENLVRLTAREAMGLATPFDDPVNVSIRVRMVPTKTTSKRLRALMLSGQVAPGKKPDLTNIIKAVEDGMNTVVFRDDALIVRIVAEKVYADTAGVDVIVRPAKRGAELQGLAA